MKAVQFYLFIAFTFIISSAYSKEVCDLTVQNAKISASGSRLRIHGRVSAGNDDCKSSSDDVSTTITISAKNSVSFRDANGVEHSGEKCTIVAQWYTAPTGSNRRQLNVPFKSIDEIDCDDDKDLEANGDKDDDSKTDSDKDDDNKTDSDKNDDDKSDDSKSDDSKSDDGESYTSYDGKATFYTPDEGACGEWNTDNDMVVAVSGKIYGKFSKKSSVCGKQMQVTNKANNKSVTVTVADACEGCAETHVDLSPAAFAKIGDFDTGILKVEWHYI